MKDCHDCRYELREEPNPVHRCLIGYGESMTKEKVKDGLIGRCNDWKPLGKLPSDELVDTTISEADAQFKELQATRINEMSDLRKSILAMVEASAPYTVAKSIVTPVSEPRQVLNPLGMTE